MMQAPTIDQQQVRRVAALAGLELSAVELSLYTGQLARILEYVQQLRDPDTEGVAPGGHGLVSSSPLRQDRLEHRDGDDAAMGQAFRQGKHGLAGFFVGQVMERLGRSADPRAVSKVVNKKLASGN